MNQRLNVLTLGVDDVTRAAEFYERLGWTVAFTDDIVMFQAGPMIISLWDRAKLADDSGINGSSSQWGGFTLGYAVADAAEVDQVCRQAADAGAKVTRPPQEKGFGYSGVFADPDGHTWEIAWIKALGLNEDGTVELPS